MASKIIFLIFVVVAAVSSEKLMENDGDRGPLSDNCIRCIYEVVESPKDAPFNIDKEYFYEAYRIKKKDDYAAEAFEKCKPNAWCSTKTVQEYMDRNLLKCTRQTPRTDPYRTVCESALILHTGGTCSETEGSPKRKELRDCLHRRALEWLAENTNDKDLGFIM